jgi:site-specific DNA-methyltransferase (adenine-specific)
MMDQVRSVLSSEQQWCVIEADAIELDKQFLMDGIVFDHCITDPPYTAHVHANMRSGHSVHVDGRPRIDICKAVAAGFASMDDITIANELSHTAERWRIMFCAMEQLGDWSKMGGWLRSGVYRKKRAMPQFSGDRPAGNCEGIAVLHGPTKKRWNGKGTHAFWQAMPEHRKVTKHPSAKPVELCCALVRLFTDPGDVIYDPFAGSGSIGIACALMGRRYVGIELQAEHVTSAHERISKPLERYTQWCTEEERSLDWRRTCQAV